METAQQIKAMRTDLRWQIPITAVVVIIGGLQAYKGGIDTPFQVGLAVMIVLLFYLLSVWFRLNRIERLAKSLGLLAEGERKNKE